MPLRAVAVALLGIAVAGCASGAGEGAPTGRCRPTIQGAPAPEYGGYDAARKAFLRSAPDGSFMAVLEDVAWLRFEGAEDEVVQRHRAYFEQGYTTFEVSLYTKEFTQPTGETFVLQDSRGARLTGRPVKYQGTMGQEKERFAARFSISFRHSLTADVDWLKLTRMADGNTLEWVFRESAPAAAQAPRGTRAAAFDRPEARPSETQRPEAQVPENLLRPRNPAPVPVSNAAGRPVNLMRVPAPPPAASAPAAAAPSVGEPVWSEAEAPSPAPASTFPAPPAAPRAMTPPAAPPAPGAPGQLPPPAVRPVR